MKEKSDTAFLLDNLPGKEKENGRDEKKKRHTITLKPKNPNSSKTQTL